MRLEDVNIQNFCSCVSIAIPLNSYNPIIGYNNSGKSNILRAISWLLHKYVLSAHMFYNPEAPVIVEGRISSVNLSLLPTNQQAQVNRFILDGGLRFRRRQDSPNVPAAQVRIEVFDPATSEWTANPTGLDNALGVLFPDPLYIEAMDDSADDISRFAAKNTIGLLLKYTVEQIRTNNITAMETVLADLATLGAHLTGPGRLRELEVLETQAATEIAEFFPGIGMHLDIQPPTLDELIKGATISLSDGHGHQRPFTSYGHGAQRTVQMALIKLLASQMNQRNGQGSVTILLIDEPELYLHPQAIERLRESLEILSTQNFQVIFSTHSPLMLGNSHGLNTSIIYKNPAGETVTRTKLTTAANLISTHSHQANVIFSLQNSTYLLFSEKVLVVEGKTESMMLPSLYKTVTSRSLSQDKTCLIEGSSSSSTWPMMQVLRAVGFTPKAVVDLDYIFKVAPQNNLVNLTDPDYVACKNWFIANQATGGYHLGSDGFPTRKNATGQSVPVPPEEAFSNMAVAMQTEIANLVSQLRALGIWVWDKGAIEACLGIQKNDTARIAFINTMQTSQSVSHASHPSDLTQLISWIS
ncbi:putative ATP-dependent endonuclease of the OLD family [Pseudomonas sp. IT-P258]|uniref:ATP-dependent nuclease n=1 Tax=Pseudomonas sp. IT-P258 TaxID=3026447 RepID=UPI0039E19FC8